MGPFPLPPYHFALLLLQGPRRKKVSFLLHRKRKPEKSGEERASSHVCVRASCLFPFPLFLFLRLPSRSLFFPPPPSPPSSSVSRLFLAGQEEGKEKARRGASQGERGRKKGEGTHHRSQAIVWLKGKKEKEMPSLWRGKRIPSRRKALIRGAI